MKSNFPTLDVVRPMPIPQALQRDRWRGGLGRSVALASFTTLAVALDEWHPASLEKRILKRAGSIQAPRRVVERLRSGKAAFTHVLRGFQEALPEVPLIFWAHHPIFQLLNTRKNEGEYQLAVLHALNTLDGSIRKHLWMQDQTSLDAGSTDVSTARIPDLSNLRSALQDRSGAEGMRQIDWLTLALVTFLEAERSRDKALAQEAAFVTNAAFDEACLRNLPLLAGWRELAAALDARVWQPAKLEGIFNNAGTRLPAILGLWMEHSPTAYPQELLKLAALDPPQPARIWRAQAAAECEAESGTGDQERN
ncbi:hypothetical protein V3391_07685 [Luteimonas sp. SMYT11W]|uniref:Uncharacterized protein n=1 Tax=Luteimonas flava TaxID=3115822 RepID=A0ABU7WDQ3_9GAMM